MNNEEKDALLATKRRKETSVQSELIELIWFGIHHLHLKCDEKTRLIKYLSTLQSLLS